MYFNEIVILKCTEFGSVCFQKIYDTAEMPTLKTTKVPSHAEII